jgi:phosphatidylethanolamine-binding protein (PEBP) family uncharacterized protein
MNLQNIHSKSIPSFPLSSPSGITNGGFMNAMYSYQGGNHFPGLVWSAVSGARSYIGFCVDVHPVAHDWIHLYLPYIDPSVTRLDEAFLQSGGDRRVLGENSFGTLGYGGPQPPPGSGPHTYVFVILALKGKLSNPPSKVESLKEIIRLCDDQGVEILQYGLLNMKYEVK